MHLFLVVLQAYTQKLEPPFQNVGSFVVRLTVLQLLEQRRDVGGPRPPAPKLPTIKSLSRSTLYSTLHFVDVVLHCQSLARFVGDDGTESLATIAPLLVSGSEMEIKSYKLHLNSG